MDGAPLLFGTQEKFTAQFGDILRVLAGTPENYVTGKHQYTLHYTLENALRPIEYGQKIALRWELPSTERCALIEHFTMDVYFPEDWNRDYVTIQGRIGDEAINEKSIRWENKHHLTVHAKEILPYTPIVIEAVRPAKDLFERISAASRSMPILLTGYVPSFILLALYFFWVLHIKNKLEPVHVKNEGIPVRYTPPKGLSFLQSVFLRDNGVGKYDILPAIIDLAQKGYVKIRRTAKGFAFQKVRDRDSSQLSEDQRYLLEGILFPYETHIFTMDRHDATKRIELKEDLETLKSKLEKWALEHGFFSQSLFEVRKVFVLKALLLAVPIVILLAAGFVHLEGNPDTSYMVIHIMFFLFSGLMFAFVIFLLVGAWYQRTIGWGITALFFLWCALFVSKLFLYPVCRSLYDVLLCPYLWVYGLIVYITVRYTTQLSPYTEKGAEAYKQMLGFEKFVSNVESDRISRMLQEDPNYLEHMLPYAMFFGYEGSWGELYDKLKYELPFWFRDDSVD